MIAASDRAQLIEDLRRAMDELGEPELTLAHADLIRPRIARILEALGEPEASPRDHRADRPGPVPSGRMTGLG